MAFAFLTLALAVAAFLAISFRLRADSALARALPPFRAHRDMTAEMLASVGAFIGREACHGSLRGSSLPGKLYHGTPQVHAGVN